MNFFEHQEQARRQTSKLVLYLVLALLGIMGSMNAIVYGLIHWMSVSDPNLSHLSHQPIWLYVSLGVLLIMGLGTAYTLYRVRKGGIGIAEQVGATPLNEGKLSLKEQQFINTVEEMAIASGLPVPQLFVMEEEAINAFVAGFSPEDTILVITRGALEAFNRDELQAVIGHEFSHILNADMNINLKIMGILGGVLILGKIGGGLLRSLRYSRRKRGDGKVLLAMAITGGAMWFAGYAGLFFGRLIKAAISRQREFLADASAVQFTRNPQGLVSAFKVMESHEPGSILTSTHREDLSHLCFGEAQVLQLSGWLSTHPPLSARIAAIDPQGQYEMFKRAPEPPPSAPPQPDTSTFMMGATLLGAGMIANTTMDHQLHAQALVAGIPQAVRDAARNVKEIESLIYAIMFYDLSIETLSTTLQKQGFFAEPITSLHRMLHEADLPSMLPVIELGMQSYHALSEEKQDSLCNNIASQLSQHSNSLLMFVLLTLLQKRRQKKPLPITLKKAFPQIVMVIETLLAYSELESDQQENCFNEILNTFFQKTLPFVEKRTGDLLEFSKALQQLNGLSPKEKAIFINVCSACIQWDHQILSQEGELLRAICASLACPMPPLLNDPDHTP